MANNFRFLALTDEGIAQLSPSAAAASKLLKSGMTLTQIYSEYVKLHSDNEKKNDEIKHLKRYMDDILKVRK